MASGEFVGKNPGEIVTIFENMVASPETLIIWMIITVLLGFGICAMGLQKGVEKITKIMMSSLFVIMVVLVIRAVTLPGASEGLKY